MTVKSVAFPAFTLGGFAAPTHRTAGAGAVTVSEIVALPVRDCASVMAAAIDFAPVVVAPETVAWKGKDAVAGGGIAAVHAVIVKRLCRGTADRAEVGSHAEAGAFAPGFAPGAVATVSSVVPPAMTDAGEAAPVPVGFDRAAGRGDAEDRDVVDGERLRVCRRAAG